MDRWVQSACVLCSNGCGCDIAVKDGKIVGVRGRASDLVNHGRLGPKGLYGSWQAHGKDRLTKPLIRRGGSLVETDWDTAMSEVVHRSQELLAELGSLSHGFYTSGQLFLEEYYTLGVIGKAGIGTPHMDGNTRLCTATAGASLKETFGSDGQPACHADIDLCDALFLFGHNMAATQTVMWARVLDRLAGPDRPRTVVVDPRRTPTAEAADVHLAPLPGTNQALLNGLVRAVIQYGWLDHEYIAAHTLGFDELKATVDPYTPEHVAEICRVSPADLVRAAEIFGTSERVLSTVLQGFYQSHQATAASCQVNNLHLLRGLIGKPGSGVLQMNGQPTAQNTRETGADGDLPGFRNWDNPEHVELNMIRMLAKLPVIAAYAHKKALGQAFLYPDNSLSFVDNFLKLNFGNNAEPYEINPVMSRALERLLILHEDHEQNASTSTVRLVGSTGANQFSSISAGINALYGPLHGGANEAVLDMLARIRDSGESVQRFVERVKNKEDGVKLMGFGHRVYKNYDPRAKLVKESADEVLRELGVEDPLLALANELEEIALNDDYFKERRLYPNVDFYTGVIYKAMGFPTRMFTPLFAIGRLPGWLAHWREMQNDPQTKIGRPQQLYVGEPERNYPTA